MNKNILLVEPAYRGKYPPLGLMKISTYHKLKGDKVVFVRGCNPKVSMEHWDRIYITTLFTYNWDETVKTILFYKGTLFNIAGKCFVGGILATLMPKELFDATGIQPIGGLLDTPNKIPQDDNTIIDDLPPDYEILKQVENSNFKYAYSDTYLGYATRGCVNNCKFCAVSTLEPNFIPYKKIVELVKGIDEQSGEKQNLLLMDNNVLASNKFDQIIDDIKNAGFAKGGMCVKTRRRRYVDFNQGLDGRLLTEEKMKRLAEIPLNPMRIAFDDIKLKNIYIKAVRLAHKYGQESMSNYILYNYKDTPEDFYERLKINIDLNEEFSKDKSGVRTVIYSFPMRYIPLNAKDRDAYTGNLYWNKRYLRSLKVILNVTKGSVMPGPEFFYQAFGENADEFKSILLMPEEFIRNRLVANWRKISDPVKRLKPYVKEWRKDYYASSKEEREELINMLSSNNIEVIRGLYETVLSRRVKRMLGYHIEEESIIKHEAHK